MKKQDLKTGYLVETREGDFALVLLGAPQGDILSNGYQSNCLDPIQITWGSLESWDDDLNYTIGTVIPESDIVRVYNVPLSGNMNIANFSLFGRDLLWEREDVITTIEQPRFKQPK